MLNFVFFALYLSVGATLLIVCPIMMHPTLPTRRKLILSGMIFLLLVPTGLALYAWLGMPQMAVE